MENEEKNVQKNLSSLNEEELAEVQGGIYAKICYERCTKCGRLITAGFRQKHLDSGCTLELYGDGGIGGLGDIVL